MGDYIETEVIQSKAAWLVLNEGAKVIPARVCELTGVSR